MNLLSLLLAKLYIAQSEHLHSRSHASASTGGVAGEGAALQAAVYLVPYQAAASKPVTVRSVKRRDRSKSAERAGRGGAGPGGSGQEGRPVMV